MNLSQNPEHGDHHNINCAVYHADGKCPGYPHSSQNSEHKHCDRCEKYGCAGEQCNCECHKHPQRVDWLKTIIPEYSSIAVLNEDLVDGYEMIKAVPFIATVETNARRSEREMVIEEIENALPSLQSCAEDEFAVHRSQIRALLTNLQKDV